MSYSSGAAGYPNLNFAPTAPPPSGNPSWLLPEHATSAGNPPQQGAYDGHYNMHQNYPQVPTYPQGSGYQPTSAYSQAPNYDAPPSSYSSQQATPPPPYQSSPNPDYFQQGHGDTYANSRGASLAGGHGGENAFVTVGGYSTCNDYGSSMGYGKNDNDTRGALVSVPNYTSTPLSTTNDHYSGGAGGGGGGGGYGAGADAVAAAYGEVLAYDGGGQEPYGARGTGSGNYWDSAPSQNILSRDVGAGTKYSNPSAGGGAASATTTTTSGSSSVYVPQFHVKLLLDGDSSASAQDVICQVALDGVKMLEPSSKRLLRVYPLETITSWAVKESSVFTFWARSAVDVEQRCVRLKSSEHVTTSILDTLTAACVQLFEMVGKDGTRGGAGAAAGSAAAAAGGGKLTNGAAADGQAGKKAGQVSLMEWVAQRTKAAQLPAPQVEKHHWVPDESALKCSACQADFTSFIRRHHCRNCGDVFCDKCTKGRTPLTAEEGAPSVRVCDHCLAEVTQRLTRLKESGAVPVPATQPLPQRSHEDLARKLQEEMERNAARRGSSGGGGGASAGAGASSGPAARGGGTFVQSCPKCGTMAIVSGASGSARCPACRADVLAPSSASSSPLGSFGEGRPGSGYAARTSSGGGGGGGGGYGGSPGGGAGYGGGSKQGAALYPGVAGMAGPPHLWSGSIPDGAGGNGAAAPRTREVACPTCTVHLQVQVPSSGTETVECGVCAHPFLVSAN